MFFNRSYPKASGSMRRCAIGLAGGLACVAMSACGGGSSGNSKSTADASSATTAVTRETEVPAFIGEFDRLCTTQVGFGGVSAYEPAPGLHPVVFFDDYRGEGFVESSRYLPAGWAVKQDSNFKDNSELKAAQLVACSDRIKETPTGVKCTFEDQGKKVELELVDATYDLKVYAATTGELKHQQTLEGKSSECPYIAAFRKGDTTFVNQPSDDDYTNALKPVVAPG
jgi:hypothetical protein